MINKEDEMKQFIEDLRDQGFDDQQIADAMEDGEYLGKTGIDQETAEEIHACLKRRK